MKFPVSRVFTIFTLFLIFFIVPSPILLFSQEGRNLLRICDLTNDDGLRMDPLTQWEERNENILNQVFDHLLDLDIDGNPSPNLAKSWKRLNTHTVQFKLNPNVYFHNGEPCDAHAVKYSLEQINIRRSPNHHMMKSIKQIDVIDPLTFNIITHYPDGLLLNRLCQSGFIIPPRYIQKVGLKGFEKHPIGSGPFKFIRWTKGKELILARNDTYWKPDLPYIDGIIFRFADARARVKMLLNGDLDMVTNFEPAALPVIEERGFIVLREPSFTAMTIMFNLRKGRGPFQDKRVRKAANYAVNMFEIIEEVRHGNGIRQATLGMPGQFGYNPYIKPYPHDPAKARQLLREAGYPNGFDASILIDDIDGGAESVLGKVLKRQLAQVGIRLRVEGGNCALRVAGPVLDKSLPAFDLDMTARTSPDPIGHVAFEEGVVWYASDSTWGIVKNQEFDQLYSRVIGAVNLREQTKLCHKLEEMVHENAFSLFAYQEIKLYATTKRVQYTPYISGALYLKEVRLLK